MVTFQLATVLTQSIVGRFLEGARLDRQSGGLIQTAIAQHCCGIVLFAVRFGFSQSTKELNDMSKAYVVGHLTVKNDEKWAEWGIRSKMNAIPV